MISADEKLRIPIAQLTKSTEYAFEHSGLNESIPYVERVQGDNEYTKLMLGDSVSN